MMTAVLTALGLFYLVAAAFVLRRARMEWFIDRAIEKISGEREPDGTRIWYMSASALIHGAAGISLVARSDWAVWLLGGGLAMQALWYGLLAPAPAPTETGEPDRRRKAWNAAIFSTATFALAAYGHRIGVLV